MNMEFLELSFSRFSIHSLILCFSNFILLPTLKYGILFCLTNFLISEGDIFGSLKVLYETRHDEKGHGFFLCEC